jgi:hypothetical protein
VASTGIKSSMHHTQTLLKETEANKKLFRRIYISEE